jgi:hypothetical protein
MIFRETHLLKANALILVARYRLQWSVSFFLIPRIFKRGSTGLAQIFFPLQLNVKT